MKTEHKFAQVLRWIADGEEIQWQNSSGTWCDEEHQDALSEIAMDEYSPERYQLKPRTITVNGREVQAGETVEPAGGTVVFIADPAQDEFHTAIRWWMESCFARWLERGLVHLTKEAAIAHAKAMLNID